MNQKFIAKLETEKYLIGSFDAYLDMTKTLIQNNSHFYKEERDNILNSMPTSYRAAITTKDGKYIGYIGLFNIDEKNRATSIRLEVNTDLYKTDKDEILEEFKKYLYESLNIKNIEELVYKTKDSIERKKSKLIPKSNIIIPSKLLVEGISQETLEKFSKDYQIPKLQMPFTIKSSDRVIGIIGLSNLIWPNRRATLNIFLDKRLGSDITRELSSYIIDEYINYVHNSNIHNITLSVNSSNKDMLDIIDKTNMNYYGQIPFSTINKDSIEANLMFQHLPNMTKERDIIISENNSISLSLLETEKKELSKEIELDNGYKLVSPKILEEKNIDLNKVLESHIKAMQNREKFTIPLGEDKYFLQRGNSNYGLYKALMNYSYIILNENNDYSGYINILRNNANGKNAVIEIGIDPKLQHRGLGIIATNRFYDELFSLGYASATNIVFAFNRPSLKLNDKIAELRGIRLEAYYINGKLWNMNYYSKTNPLIEKIKSKHL